MKISCGDLIDRLTILERKIRYCKKVKDKKIIENERCKLYKYLLEFDLDKNKNYNEILSLSFELMSFNADIWNLEGDIRSYKEGELGLREVGKRALMIRDLNKLRIRIKNKINELTETGFKEIKINHRSEESYGDEKHEGKQFVLSNE